MPFSHHSHSGQFCPGHAQNSLEEVVQTAIEKGLRVLGLTEHMPRHDQDKYPEEVENGMKVEDAFTNQDNYYVEADRLREKYGSQIQIIIGFETDWVRPESLDLIQRTIRENQFDFFVGSVHHVHTIPIDYDQSFYLKARQIAGGTDERLFEDYFDVQLAMLQAITPPIVGHFDLIRLKSDNPNGSFRPMPGVWSRILRNLDYINSYGGILELNYASIRKGMDEPYPRSEICEVFVAQGGKFCLSDDSHGVDQVALNYDRLPSFLRKAGIEVLYFLRHVDRPSSNPFDPRFPFCVSDKIAVQELGSSLDAST